MKHRSIPCLHAATLLTLLILFSGPRALAHFAHVWEAVPLDRLLVNVGKFVKEHPSDARGYYTLGRLHSLAFAQRGKDGKVGVVAKDRQTGKPLPLPGFPPVDTVQVTPPPSGGTLQQEAKNHLIESLRLYRRATELDPKNALYFLGYGWMLEQGASLIGKEILPPGEPSGKASPEAWREQALAADRVAYALAIPKELQDKGQDLNEGDRMTGVEAGQGILRLLAKRTQTAAEKSEVMRVRRDLATINAKPGWITPIILSLRPGASLSDLLAPDRSVSFDLEGNGQTEHWPWLRPDTGLLVWDPDKTGRIVSGRQLFGSRTWQMFWRDGYAPLAALDNDGDGWLSGAELEGLAVWFDRNGNGVSDRGEIVPVQALGIVRIAVRAEGTAEGVLFNRRGVELKDGRFLPTYDWTPRSLGRPHVEKTAWTTDAVWN